jgi:hypothetical protein
VADVAVRQTIPVDRSHIIGHSEVPGATHTDPGDGWDWDLYMDLISDGEPTATLRGVVAAEDVYAGERLVGASVWLPETGDTTTSGENGAWAFPGIPFGTYTVHAVADGYDEGTCTTRITTSGDAWCSIALLPSGAPPDDTGVPPDTATDDDTGRRRHRAPSADTARGGCGCGAAPSGRGSLWLGVAGSTALALLRRRRRGAT